MNLVLSNLILKLSIHKLSRKFYRYIDDDIIDITLMEQITQSTMTEMLTASADKSKGIYIGNNIGYIESTNALDESDYRMLNVYRASDYQVAIVNSGEIELECDIQSVSLQAGNILLLVPGSLVSTKSKTPDYDATIISLNADAMDGIRPSTYKVIRINEMGIVGKYKSLLTELLNKNGEKESSLSLIKSMIHYLLELATEEYPSPKTGNHHYSIYKSFVALLNKDGRKEHQSGYYADKLCISLNYLNEIVKENSGRTVFQWINEYLATEAKAILFHSTMNVQQISDYLYFPNSAFFCRFFKNHTGHTPSQFRKNKRL